MLIFFQLLSWLRVESSFLVALFHTVLLRMFAWRPYMYLRKNGQTQQQFFNSGCHACISCPFKIYIGLVVADHTVGYYMQKSPNESAK